MHANELSRTYSKITSENKIAVALWASYEENRRAEFSVRDLRNHANRLEKERDSMPNEDHIIELEEESRYLDVIRRQGYSAAVVGIALLIAGFLNLFGLAVMFFIFGGLLTVGGLGSTWYRINENFDLHPKVELRKLQRRAVQAQVREYLS